MRGRKNRTKSLPITVLSVAVLSVALVWGLTSAPAFADDAEEPAGPAVYNVWVNGIQVDENNKTDIFNNGKASYDPESKTLTLKNITLNGAPAGDDGYTKAIVYAEDQDLNLVCTNVTLDNIVNTCQAVYVDYGSLTISGTLTAKAAWDRAIDVYGGSLTIDGDVTAITTSRSYGGYLSFSTETAIRASKDITVNGALTAEGTECGIESYEGNVTLTGGPMSIKGDEDEAIDIKGTVTISCDVDLVSNQDDAVSANTITIESGTVSAISNDDGRGFRAETVTINGGDVTTAGPRNGIEADFLTVNGGTLTASCGNSEGIDAEELVINGGTVTATSQHENGLQGDSVIINGGTVNATGGDDRSAGIYAFETIKIGNGITKIIASGTEGAIAIYGREGLTIGRSVAVIAPEDGSVQTQVETSEGDVFYTIKEADETTVATYVELVSDAVPCTLTFDLAGGTLDGETGSITYDVYTGDDFPIPEGPTLEGYTFQYWTDAEQDLDWESVVENLFPAEEQTAKYYPGDTYVVDGDHGFTAVFQEASSGDDEPDEPENPDEPGGGSGNQGGGQSATPDTGDDLSPIIFMLAALALGMLFLLAGARRSLLRELQSR